MCFRNESSACPQDPDLEVLAGQPSISSFCMLLVAAGAVVDSGDGALGVLVLKPHLNNIFWLVGWGVSCY